MFQRLQPLLQRRVLRLQYIDPPLLLRSLLLDDLQETLDCCERYPLSIQQIDMPVVRPSGISPGWRMRVQATLAPISAGLTTRTSSA